MSGAGLVVGAIAIFFALGVTAGVLAVLALSATRDHRQRGRRRYRSPYATGQTDTLAWGRPWPPAGPDWEDRPGWQEDGRPDNITELRPAWPAGRRGLTPRGD